MKKSVFYLLVIITALLCNPFFSWQTKVFAADPSPNITRVTLELSADSAVRYADQFSEDPPAISIEFLSRNFTNTFEPVLTIKSGIIKEIVSEYYPIRFGRRALKRLTLRLIQPTSYVVTQRINKIIVDIETPLSLMVGSLDLGNGVTLLGIEARETFIKRFKVMGEVLQFRHWATASARGAPQTVRMPVPDAQSPESVEVSPSPLSEVQADIGSSGEGISALVMKPGKTLKSTLQLDQISNLVLKSRNNGLWFSLLLGIGAISIVTWWYHARRLTGRIILRPSINDTKFPFMVKGASIFEQWVLKAMNRQDYEVVGSKPITGLTRLWIIQKNDERQGLVCLDDRALSECGVIKQVVEAIRQENLSIGAIATLGHFSFPAKLLASENHIQLISREESFKLIEGELNNVVTVEDTKKLTQELAHTQSELAKEQARVKSLGQESVASAEFKQKAQVELEAWEKEVEMLRDKWQEAGRELIEEQNKEQMYEQRVGELTRQLAVNKENCFKASEETKQLKLEIAEADQCVKAERAARAGLEGHIASLRVKLGEVATGRPKLRNGNQHSDEKRRWTRRDVSVEKGAILVSVGSDSGNTIAGGARNIGGGGLCAEFLIGGLQADEFDMTLYLSGRTNPIETIGRAVWKGRGSLRGMERVGLAFSVINLNDQETINELAEAC